MTLRSAVVLTLGAALTLTAPPLAAQAFTPPEGVGAVTVAWQYVDNTGHRFTDGFLRRSGQSVTMSALFELDYGVTDRLSVTAGVPYVFAKYTGALPPPSNLPVDACACWHSSFQDLSLAARYRFGDDAWAITPLVRHSRPTHDYRYQGEAVVGRNLQETQLGVSAALRLPGALRKGTIETGYTRAFVEKPLPDVGLDRSDGYVNLGYQLGQRVFVRGGATFQRTHGGLRIGSPTGDPFFPPGELNTGARFAQRDRVLQTRYWQAGAGIAYSMEHADIFASYSKYIWGRNAHDGAVYTVGTTFYFDAPWR
jgi:hypothetical protein